MAAKPVRSRPRLWAVASTFPRQKRQLCSSAFVAGNPQAPRYSPATGGSGCSMDLTRRPDPGGAKQWKQVKMLERELAALDEVPVIGPFLGFSMRLQLSLADAFGLLKLRALLDQPDPAPATWSALLDELPPISRAA
jgi:hypothetical protein